MRRRPTVLAVCALALAGCGDYSAPSEVVNGVATASVKTPDATFTQYRTFTVTDTIQVVDNTGATNTPYTQDVPEIVNQVKKNMTDRGYQYIPFSPGVRADLVIGLYAYLGSQAYGTYYCYYYYWGYYPYGCTGGYYYYGEYNYGTLVLRMADFKNAPPATTGAELPIVWGAASYAVLGTPSYNLQRVLASIDTAFAQSPYLHP